jgi:uncharacterized surface anchored protein
MEQLDDRILPAAGLISGHVFQDTTGNGLSADDVGLGKVAIQLYQDSNKDGTLDSGDKLLATQQSAADGSYSFGNLGSARYFVKESVPGNDVLTAPTPGTYYTVNLAAGQQAGGQNFDNFQKLNTSLVTNVSFTVITPGGTQTTVTNLRGNTQQGDTVVANFTIAPTSSPVTVSLVSYNAPGSSFNAGTAAQQSILVVATGTFSAGQHSLTVQLPDNYYQVDFIAGQAIDQFGPANGNIFYSAEGRLLSADNGGTNAVTYGTVSGTVTGSNGTALSGATVTLTNLVNQSQVVATTSSNGTYSFSGVQAGLPYTVTVSAPGYTPQTSDVAAQSGSNSISFALTPTQQFATLTGIVTGPIGSPVSGAIVTLLDANGVPVGNNATTDANGVYTLSDIPPGTYTLSASTGENLTYSGTVTLVPGTTSMDITISSGLGG